MKMVCATEKERVSGKRESLVMFMDVLTKGSMDQWLWSFTAHSDIQTHFSRK